MITDGTSGPKSRKRYLLVACTSLLTYDMVGDRSLATFKAFVFPDLSGTVVVHDRYQNYDKFPGITHQLCLAHLLRDVEDAVQCHPGAIWPGQIADALRGLIHQANLAREAGQAAVPDDAIAADLRLFRRGVAVGLSQVRRIPGANSRQPPSRLLLECLRGRERDILRFLSDLRIPPTSNQAERDVRPATINATTSPRMRYGGTHSRRIRGEKQATLRDQRRFRRVGRKAVESYAETTHLRVVQLKLGDVTVGYPPNLVGNQNGLPKLLEEALFLN